MFHGRVVITYVGLGCDIPELIKNLATYIAKLVKQSRLFRLQLESELFWILNYEFLFLLFANYLVFLLLFEYYTIIDCKEVLV